MVAEYQPDRVNPQTGKYCYYTTDQVNSTRVVLDITTKYACWRFLSPSVALKDVQEGPAILSQNK